MLDSVLPNREERSMGRRGYPPEFRRKAVRVLAAEGIPVEVACRVLGVSTSGYYAWRPARHRSDRSAMPG